MNMNNDWMYWACGFVALGLYWLSKDKTRPTMNIQNIAWSVLAVFLGLAMGVYLQGEDPGGLAIAYAVSIGIAGGTTVKTTADVRARVKARNEDPNA